MYINLSEFKGSFIYKLFYYLIMAKIGNISKVPKLKTLFRKSQASPSRLSKSRIQTQIKQLRKTTNLKGERLFFKAVDLASKKKTKEVRKARTDFSSRLKVLKIKRKGLL